MIDIAGKKFITIKEASKKFGFSEGWFRKVKLEKKGPTYIKMLGKKKGRVLYPLPEIDEWFAVELAKKY